LNILSFRLNGQFSAFRDPSVTSNQTVYYIPSKSAVIGLLGAMIGIQRNNSLDQIYGNSYINFFSKTQVGVRFESQPRKTTYYTNHRSFEKATMKPFKTELVENPQYRIFVYLNNDSDQYKKLQTSIFENTFVYSPYLGHAYCPAIVSEPKNHPRSEEIMRPEGQNTSSVILDESETYNNDSHFKIKPKTYESSIIIERHIHHFYRNNGLEKRVLKHWIPVNSSPYRIDRDGKRDLSKFYKVENEIVCMY
jgi:CRISPR-associated protein Cas5h